MSKMADSDDEMTPEERLEWLRERGVLIETAEERKAKQEQVKQALEVNEEGQETMEHVAYVLIPADSSQAMQQLSMPVRGRNHGIDLLEAHLKSSFSCSSSEMINIDLLKEQASKQFGTANTPTISDSALRKAASQGSVETFRLVPSMESNHFKTINFYLDEVGMLKNLPLNARATQLALKAGFNPPPKLYGDIFVGRLSTKPILKNIDFLLGQDTSFESASWLNGAISENLKYQSEINQLTGRIGELQPSGDGENGQEKDENGFKWIQTSDEIEIKIPVNISRTSDVRVQFKPTSVKAFVKNELVTQVNLYGHVDPDGCTWTIDEENSQSIAVVTCEKVEAMSWPRIHI